MSDNTALLTQILSEIEKIHTKIDHLIDKNKPLPGGANIYVATIQNAKINNKVGTMYSYDIYLPNRAKPISNDGFLRKQGDEGTLIAVEMALDSLMLQQIGEVHINVSLAKQLDKDSFNQAVRGKLANFKKVTIEPLNISNVYGAAVWNRISSLLAQYTEELKQEENNANG